MGAIFRVKIIETSDLVQSIKEMRKHHFKLMVTSLQTDNSIYDIEFNKKIIVIGNESNGVSEEIQDMADEKAKIPMLGKTESLNASVCKTKNNKKHILKMMCFSALIIRIKNNY